MIKLEENLIQTNYVTYLEIACNNIGINRHEMKYFTTATIDAKIINEEINNLYSQGQKYLQERKINSEASIEDVKRYVKGIKHSKINNYSNKPKHTERDKNPPAQKIMADLYNAYHLGLRIGYLHKENELLTDIPTRLIGKIKPIFYNN